VEFLDYPNLIRLNPNIPFKTRGNGSVAIRINGEKNDLENIRELVLKKVKDMAKLDDFTLNVLCNHEVIAVDQDPLGQQARIIRKSDEDFVLVKDMEDGSKAVGIFNLKKEKVRLSVNWEDLGLRGKQKIRDLWRQVDIGYYQESFNVEIPAHGVSMIRIWPER